MTSLAVGRDEADTTWLFSSSAFGELKQWWPAALELIYQNTAEHPGSDSKVSSLQCPALFSNLEEIYITHTVHI